MDGFKELIGVLESRLKSRVIGSIIIAFIATNWKVIFFVLFEKVTAAEKFKYFDEHTTPISLFLIPIIAGALFSIIVPWVSYLGMKINSLPEQKQRELRHNATHLDAVSKLKYEEVRNKMQANKEVALIESAKRDSEIKKIEDIDVRNSLEGKIKETREDSAPHLLNGFENVGYSQYSIDEFKKEILSITEQIRSTKDLIESEGIALDVMKMGAYEKEEEYQSQIASLNKEVDEEKIMEIKYERAQFRKEAEETMVIQQEIFHTNIAQLDFLEFEKEKLIAAFDAKYG